MSKENNLADFVKDLADAIREVEGTTELINPQDFSSHIRQMSGNSDQLVSLVEGSVSEIKSTDLEGVTKIRSGAFKNCKELTSLEIPDSVVEIGEGALEGCTSLNTLALPFLTQDLDGYIFGVGWNDFNNNYNLKSLEVRNGDIGESVCIDCDTLETLILGEGVTSIGEEAFSGSCNIKHIKIPDTVKRIEPNAFYSRDYLESLDLGNGVEYIGDNAFYCNDHNKGVETLVIPDSVKTIGVYAFESWYSLHQLTIGAGITNIGYGCFCNSPLKTLTCKALTPPTINYDTFESMEDDCVIYVPEESVEAYKSATNWSAYADKIQAIPIPPTEGLAYKFDSDNKVYGVSGIGTATDTDIVIPDVYKGFPVVKVQSGAFKNNANITSVVIPDSVTSIDSDAFYNCPSLTSVIIGNSVTSIGNSVFYNCRSLTSIVIPDSVTSIGNKVFYYCKSLTSVVIPDLVTSIGETAFYECDLLTSVVIGSSVTSIGSSAFYNCQNLTSITCKATTPPTLVANSFGSVPTTCAIYVPAGSVDAYKSATNWSTRADYIQAITTDGLAYTLNSNNASYSVSGIGTATDTDIVIPSTYEGLPVTKIGDSAFNNIRTITSVIIPNTVTQIGNGAFSYSSLRSIEIPASVTYIGQYAFMYAGVQTINYLGTIDQWATIYFADLQSVPSGQLKIDGQVVTEVNLTAVTRIANYAFYNMSNLTSVTIGGSVTSIGMYAFNNCRLLTTVVIGDSVTSISDRAFENCNSLTSVVIGDSVTSISSFAFQNCTNCLEYDFSNCTSVPTLKVNVFSGINANAKIIVPDALYDSWIAATNWSNYASYIIKKSEYTGG